MTARRVRPPASLPRRTQGLLAAYREAESIPRRVDDRIWSVVGSEDAPLPAYDPLPAQPAAAVGRVALGWAGFAVAAAVVLALAWQVGGTRAERDQPGAAPDAAVMQSERSTSATSSSLRPTSPSSDASAEEEAPAAQTPKIANPKTVVKPRPAKQDAPREPSPESASTFTAERKLVARAWRALAEDDEVAALAVAAEHRRRFPSGLLVPEREAIDIIARCRRGDADGGERASAFHRIHPRSPLRERIDGACVHDAEQK